MPAGTESIARPVWERDAPHGSRKNRAVIIEVGFLEERPIHGYSSHHDGSGLCCWRFLNPPGGQCSR